MEHPQSDLSVAFEIDSYISPNLSPEVLIACGPDAEIAQFADQIGKVESATILARASDGNTAFLKAHLVAIRYLDFLRLMQARPSHVEMPFVRRVSPSNENGRIGDLGNPHAPEVIVGVLADARALDGIKTQLPWAKWRPLDLGHAGRGALFRPEEGDVETYWTFVRDAAAGHYANADVVLLKQVHT